MAARDRAEHRDDHHDAHRDDHPDRHDQGTTVRSRLAPLALALALVAAIQAAPNDPHYPQQWGLQRIAAPQAWSVSRGEGIVVAVVDSGVDLSHPDLAGAFARRPDGSILGYDFVDDDEVPTDDHGHGTMVAGIVAARTSNGIDVASVAPQARLMPVRVLDGRAQGSAADVDAGIRWAVDHGAHVINLSLEVARETGEDDALPTVENQAPAEAVRYAWERGVVVVAAAGNDSSEFTDYPADSPVLLVGASTREDERAGFSDTGRRDAVIAPGVDIVSTWCDPCGEDSEHAVGQADGTSYAAPHVAGTVALLRAAGHDHRSAVQTVRETARDVGAPGPDRRTGHGRIDAAAALGADEPESGGASPTPEDPSPAPTRSREAAGGVEEPTAPPTPEPSPSPSSAVTGGDGGTASPQPTPDATDEPDRRPDRRAGAGDDRGAVAVAWKVVAVAMLAASAGALAAVGRSLRRGTTR